MRYLVSVLTALLFFIWILPLGIFIKPSQEKIACGGQRAICLCSHAQSKVKSNAMEAYGLKNNSNNNKESNASGGAAGHYYLAAYLFNQNNLTPCSLNDAMFLAYHNPFLKSIEHIPKV
jgi:hypothetical protein